jgi:hypothetical protein
VSPNPTAIYHITHVNNLDPILLHGCLLAGNAIQRSNVAHRSIAYPSIQDRRARVSVPCGPGGTLHDYVPFYFAPRCPMLYTINRGNVEGIQDQQPIIHLASTAEAVQAGGQQFVFTDGHGVMQFTGFFDNLADLNRVDWQVMRSRYWRDTQQDPDRKRRRQAEFLVYDGLRWNLISEIGVYNRGTECKVLAELARGHVQHRPVVRIRRDWYY